MAGCGGVWWVGQNKLLFYSASQLYLIAVPGKTFIGCFANSLYTVFFFSLNCDLNILCVAFNFAYSMVQLCGNKNREIYVEQVVKSGSSCWVEWERESEKSGMF